MADNQSIADHLPQNRVVAFLDILGFRAIVASMRRRPEIYSLIETILKNVAEEQESYRTAIKKQSAKGMIKRSVPFIEMEQSQFSDSVVISQPLTGNDDGESVSTTIHFASRFASKLLLQGILVRGGISSGWTYHSRNVIFGDGLINAYELESSVSRVPRIVVADHLMDKVPQFELKHKLKRDSDGFHFINVFTELWSYGVHLAIPDPFQFNQVREHLLRSLEEAQRSNKPDIIGKVRWLAREFDEAIEDNARWPGFRGVKKLLAEESPRNAEQSAPADANKPRR